MEKEFIPCEQALVLKELGFDEPCLGNYRLPTNRLITEWEIRNTPEHTLGISAPLYQQAFRWFREKYDLEFNIDIQTKKSFSTVQLEKTYSLRIIKSDEVSTERHNKLLWTKLNMKSIEEAELECLKKLIEIVKENKL
jgi:hypothetical protein